MWGGAWLQIQRARPCLMWCVQWDALLPAALVGAHFTAPNPMVVGVGLFSFYKPMDVELPFVLQGGC